MIDKYLLEDLSLRRDEKGELARWVIQLQADVDTERRKSASLESVIYARDTRIAELEQDELATRASSRAVHEAQENHINQQQDIIESLEKKNVDLGRALGAAEKRLAAPVRLPKRYVISLYDDVDWEPHPNGDSYACEEVIVALREQGFTVVEDE